MDESRFREARLPDYTSPFDEDYESYYMSGRLFNQQLFREFRGVFEAVFHDMDDTKFLINSVGSDARYEKGPVSPLELAVYVDEDTAKNPLYKRLTYYANELTSAKVVDDEIEWRNIDKVKPARMPSKNGQGLLSPNRIFDGRPLHGNVELRTKQLEYLAEEAQQPRGARNLNSLKKKVREYHETTRDGKQNFRGEELTHFTPESGQITYDGNHRWGVKMGPVRTIQFALARDKYRMLRDGFNPKILGEIDRHVVKQLDDLRSVTNQNITDSTVSSLQDQYKYFLHSYHQSQWKHRIQGEEVLSRDSQEFKHRLNEVYDIIDITRGEDQPSYFFSKPESRFYS